MGHFLAKAKRKPKGTTSRTVAIQATLTFLENQGNIMPAATEQAWTLAEQLRSILEREAAGEDTESV